MQLIKKIWWLATICILLASGQVYAEQIGQIGLLNGTVFVIKSTGKRIVVAEGSVIDSGDIVVTGNESKAMVAFTDGSKVSLRPNTTFQIAEYHYNAEQPQQDNAFFNLVKGGLRTVTGLIGKRGNHDAYRLGNNTATIGIRGTEYVARVCEPSCDAEATTKPKSDKPIIKKFPIAKVVLLRGSATREGADATDVAKPLAENDYLYLGDTLSTAQVGTLGILFTDGSRIVLPSNTAFKLAGYSYSQQVPDNNTMLVRLLKGSARVVTGLIGKHNPRSVNYQTQTATIGIRGTDFDMACLDSGSAEADKLSSTAAPTTGECDKALVSTVRQGAVEVDTGKGTQRVEAGKSGYADAPESQPVLLNNNPKLFDDDVPLPGTLKSDTVKEFGSTDTNMSKPGIYVSVIEGKVVLQQGVSNLNLSQGQSGFANSSGNEVQLLGSTPSGINNDPFLQNVKFNAFSCGL